MSSNHSNNDQASSLPHPNPLQTAWDHFLQSTPFVTRTILILQAASFVVSWFFDMHYSLGNIPYYSFYKLEIYRIALSPFLVNSSFLSVVVAYLSFVDHGKRLEYSMGSTAFAWLCFAVGLTSNLLFIAISLVYSTLFGVTYLYHDASGIWIVLFATLAVECVRAPRESKRQILLTDVPVLYYPAAIFVLFALVGAIHLGHILSLGLGYALGRASSGEDTSNAGQLLEETLLLDSVRAKAWEDAHLSRLTDRPGWVVGHAAAGAAAWNESSAGMTLPTFRPPTTTTIEAGTIYRTGTSDVDDGRMLGGTTRRANNNNTAETTRAARLQALDARPDDGTNA